MDFDSTSEQFPISQDLIEIFGQNLFGLLAEEIVNGDFRFPFVFIAKSHWSHFSHGADAIEVQVSLTCGIHDNCIRGL